MPTVEIVVAYINQPKLGKRNGTIKSAAPDDKYYGASPNILPQFKVGETCTIEYDTSPKTGGGEWLNLKRKISTSSAPLVPPLRNRTNPEDSKQMFVTALLKEGVASGKINISTVEIVAVGNALKESYDQLFGSAAKQITQTVMDDEVPY